MRIVALLVTALLLGGCGAASDERSEPSFTAILEDPEEYDGERVTFEAGYYGAFEVSVLTSGFAESFPPQPVEPLVWVNAGPTGQCLEREETVTWAEGVRASGIFQYDPERGFGHLGAYEMALEDPTITCV